MMVPRQKTGGAVELGLVRPHRRGKITVGRGHGDVTRHPLSAIRNDRAHLSVAGDKERRHNTSPHSHSVPIRAGKVQFFTSWSSCGEKCRHRSCHFKIPHLNISPVKSSPFALVDSDFIEKCQLLFFPWRAVALAKAG